MSDKDYEILMEFTEQLLKKKVTKEEALQSFIQAGILDENGNYTEPYKCFEVTRVPS
ncbi:hypothetical protein [Chitinophaga sp.]|uniref:hypothetical protein n=1 Tax=Chitinophaga sp. TaxID=1869181 RepID=UPI002F95D3F4